MMASALATQFLLPPPSSSYSSFPPTNSLIRTSSTKNSVPLALLSKSRRISSSPTPVLTPKRNPFPAPPAAATDTDESPSTEAADQLSEPAPVEVQIAASAAAEVPKGEDVFAVVMVGSRQYIVFPGRFLYTQRLKDANVDDKIILNKVLLVGTREKAYIGQPVVTNAAVHAVVEEQGLNKKVIVYKYKRKKNYRRNIGHRQPNTRIRITGITGYEDFPADTLPETVPA